MGQRDIPQICPKFVPNGSPYYSLRLYEELIAKDVHSTKWGIAIRPDPEVKQHGRH
jgi:hypothetical protein